MGISFGGRARKIALERDLYDRLVQVAAAAGYASVEEFVVHLLEKAAPPPASAESEEEVRKRLRGLGYLE
jgi:hypothetical protein